MSDLNTKNRSASITEHDLKHEIHPRSAPLFDLPFRKDKENSGSHAMAFAGLYLFTLLLYIRPQEMFPDAFGAFPLVKTVAIIAIVTYLVSKLLHGERPTIWPIELKMLAVMVLLAVIFIPVAASPQESINALFDPFLKVTCIFLLMINLVTTRKRLYQLLNLVVVCGTILALMAIRSYLAGEFAIKGLRIIGAVGGMFGNPNDLATSLNLLLPLAIALALTRRGLVRAAYFACAAALLAGVVVTFSRGGFLGLIAVSAFLLWKLGGHHRALVAATFVLLLGLFVLASPGGYAQRMVSIFYTDLDPTGSAQLRQDHLERALNVAINHPFIGVGIANYHIYSLKEQKAHNSYLEISAELGIAGLIAYLILIFSPIRSLKKISRQALHRERPRASPHEDETISARNTYYLSTALQGALIAYIVCSFFSSIQYQWYLYYLVAYAIALKNIAFAHQEETLETGSKVSLQTEGVLWKQRRAGA